MAYDQHHSQSTVNDHFVHLSRSITRTLFWVGALIAALVLILVLS